VHSAQLPIQVLVHQHVDTKKRREKLHTAQSPSSRQSFPTKPGERRRATSWQQQQRHSTGCEAGAGCGTTNARANDDNNEMLNELLASAASPFPSSRFISNRSWSTSHARNFSGIVQLGPPPPAPVVGSYAMV
jgi:hypothetical protein